MLVMFLFGAATALAQDQSRVELRIESTALEFGEAVNVQIVCTNIPDASVPEGVVPDGLDLQLVQPNPTRMSRTTIINGRRSDEVTLTYHLRLVALKEGEYALGPLTVEGGGTTHRIDPVRIVVRARPSGDEARGDAYVWAEIEVSPQRVYVTQTYKATLRIGIRKLRDDLGRSIDINPLSDVLDQSASQFSIFAGGSVQGRVTYLADSSGERQPYDVYEIVKEARAEAPGTATVGPVFIRANYPTRLRRGFFGRVEVAASRRESAGAGAVAVTIQAPPTEGRPPSFRGAIGRFTIDISARPDRVSLGQPVTLTIAIEGSGTEGIAGPDLSRNAELRSRFDFSDGELTGDLEGNRKVFRVAIFPRQEGDQTIPPIAWSYFDVRREEYVTLRGEPIPISVAPAPPGGTIAGGGPSAASPRSKGELTAVTEGILPNYTDPEHVLADQSLRFDTVWIGVVAGLPVLYAAGAILRLRRDRARTDRTWVRRRSARPQAEAAIRAALRGGTPPDQVHAVARAFARFVSDRRALPTADPTPEEVRRALLSAGMSADEAAAIADWLQASEACRYGSFDGATSSPREVAGEARRWMKRVERLRTSLSPASDVRRRVTV
jgi:hypothetical protein